MLRQRALSLAMQMINTLLIHLPEFRTLGLHVLDEHVNGRISVLGDAGVIRGVTRQLEIATRQFEVPQRALDVVSEVRRVIVELEFATREGPVSEFDNIPALVNGNPVAWPQLQDERGCVRHLGLGYLNFESREFRFTFFSFSQCPASLKWDLQQYHRGASPQGASRSYRRSSLWR
jgi:hypothetical protein